MAVLEVSRSVQRRRALAAELPTDHPECLDEIEALMEDLPDPDTPVTQVKSPRGISTSIFLRLFSRAPRMVKKPCSAGRLSRGRGIRFLPDRY